jgi:hypothetical protein
VGAEGGDGTEAGELGDRLDAGRRRLEVQLGSAHPRVRQPGPRGGAELVAEATVQGPRAHRRLLRHVAQGERQAFRGGLLYGLVNGWDLVKSVTLANRIGAIKIAAAGPQNYTLDRSALGV